MNIAIISPWAVSPTSIGGTERFIIDLASGLHKLGEEVEVFTLSGENRTIDGVKYISLDIFGKGKQANEYDLQRFAGDGKDKDFFRKWADYLEQSLDVSKFDVIQLNSLLFIDAWPKKFRIFTIHTTPFEYQLDWGKGGFENAVEKIQSSRLGETLLVAPSRYYANRFSKIFGKEIISVPHAMDATRLERPTQAKQIKRGENKDKITILLPSRLELVQKRPQIVFRGVAMLPGPEREKIEIIATGTDDQYQPNQKMLMRIAEKDGFKAQFNTYKSMAEAYSLADIVALPSRSESFGYAALESLALGIPTILNSLPTFNEIGAGNIQAHFFNHTAKSFSETLLALLNSELKKREVSKTWMDRYDIHRWAQNYQLLARKISQNV